MVIHSGIILVIMFIIRLMIKIVSGLHPTQNNINIASAGEINYKPRRPNDQVLNPKRVGLYLKSQRGQGGFNSCPQQVRSLVSGLDLSLIPWIFLNLHHKYWLLREI